MNRQLRKAVDPSWPLSDPSGADRPVGHEYQDQGTRKKKLRKTERPMTTALFMLRCVELGLNIADLDLLTIGSVNDMFTEKSRDSIEWHEHATQADMDKI